MFHLRKFFSPAGGKFYLWYNKRQAEGPVSYVASVFSLTKGCTEEFAVDKDALLKWVEVRHSSFVSGQWRAWTPGRRKAKCFSASHYGHTSKAPGVKQLLRRKKVRGGIYQKWLFFIFRPRGVLFLYYDFLTLKPVSVKSRCMSRAGLGYSLGVLGQYHTIYM